MVKQYVRNAYYPEKLSEPARVEEGQVVVHSS